MIDLSTLLAFAVGVLALCIILKIISIPIKLIIKLVINALVGGIVLLLINYFGAMIGFTIDINWLTALIVGIFGVPGVIIVAILQFFVF